MKKLGLFIATAVMLVLFAFSVSAETETEGPYAYLVDINHTSIITEVDKTISGDITIPSTLGGYPVTFIEIDAFANCKNLTSVVIPGSVKSISLCAFYNCTNLTSVVMLEGVTGIDEDAFGNCKNLKTITLPKSIKTIDEYAFRNCVKLDTVNYSGSERMWKSIEIYRAGNTNLLNSHINFTCTHKNANLKSKTTATLTNDGHTAGTYCDDCEAWIEGHKTIYKISSVTLSKTNYIYDGKNKTPKVTVKDADGNTLVKNVDYKLTVASKRSGIGRYTVKVTFIGNYSGSKSVYFYIKPGKPATVKSASQTTSSVKLTWSAVPGAAGYTVYRYSPSKKAYVKAGSTEGTSLTVKSLYAGTKYTFRVVAYGKTSAGKVYDSDSYALLKTATKTKTPTLSKVTTTKGKAVLTHTNVSGETGYTVYYSTKKDSGFKKYANFKSDTTTCNITKLTSGKTYYFKVRTYITTDSGYVYSAWSTVKSVKVK